LAILVFAAVSVQLAQFLHTLLLLLPLELLLALD
jgi:hypothetical protein